MGLVGLGWGALLYQACLSEWHQPPPPPPLCSVSPHRQQRLYQTLAPLWLFSVQLWEDMNSVCACSVCSRILTPVQLRPLQAGSTLFSPLRIAWPLEETSSTTSILACSSGESETPFSSFHLVVVSAVAHTSVCGS